MRISDAVALTYTEGNQPIIGDADIDGANVSPIQLSAAKDTRARDANAILFGIIPLEIKDTGAIVSGRIRISSIFETPRRKRIQRQAVTRRGFNELAFGLRRRICTFLYFEIVRERRGRLIK